MPIRWNMRNYLYFSGLFVFLVFVLLITLWLIFTILIKPAISPLKLGITQQVFTLLFLVMSLMLAFVSLSLARKEQAQRENDAKVRDSEARFRTLLDSAPDAIVIVDSSGLIQIVNSQTENWFGYPREALLGQPVEMLIPERYRKRHHLYRSSYSKNPSTRPMGGNAELYGLRKDGSEFPLEISLSPSEFNGQTWVTSIVRDITARKQMEIERQLAQTRYLELVNNLPVGVFRISDKENSRFREVNPAMVEIFAADNAEVLLNTPCEALFSEQTDWTNYLQQLQNQVSTGTVELNMRTLGQHEFVASITTAVKHSPSEGTYYDGILENITERKRQEGHIQKLNEDLQRRSRELEVINRELESFSYSVSHDLRAPLRAMDGFSSTLLREYGPKLDDRGRERLERVRAAAQRMATLIDDLLNLSRVSRTDVVWQDVDLANIAREIIAELRQSDPNRDIQLNIPSKLPAKADQRLMMIALTNLLNNAWKFTSHTPNPMIELSCELQDSIAVYCVRDNGAGFDMEFSAKLFGAFQRLHDANEFPGTGIGLATVQRIIHKHGGSIWAEGSVNQGAAFYFTIKNSGDL